MNYLEKLKLLMKQHGLNENQLAKKANVPQSTINSLFQKNNLLQFQHWRHYWKPWI